MNKLVGRYIFLAVCLLTTLGCGSDSDVKDAGHGFCEKLDDCNLLQPGVSVDDCNETFDDELDGLTSAERREAERETEEFNDCLELSCGNFLQCVSAIE